MADEALTARSRALLHGTLRDHLSVVIVTALAGACVVHAAVTRGLRTAMTRESPRAEQDAGSWHGKPWACAQLAAATDADVLVLVDADVRLDPGAVGGRP